MTKALWRIYWYSRYGEEKTIGYVIADENTDYLNNSQGYLLNGQPCALSRDRVKEIDDV